MAMDQDEIAEQRAVVVEEALSWTGTPYHHLARLKGVGTDCAMYLYEVFTRCGYVKSFHIPPYNPQWHIHRQAEKYIGFIMEHADEMPVERAPQPADIIVWRFGRTFSHGGIVIEWPLVSHAYSRVNAVTQTDVNRATYLTHIGEHGPEHGKVRPMKIFSLRQWN